MARFTSRFCLLILLFISSSVYSQNTSLLHYTFNNSTRDYSGYSADAIQDSTDYEFRVGRNLTANQAIHFNPTLQIPESSLSHLSDLFEGFTLIAWVKPSVASQSQNIFKIGDLTDGNGLSISLDILSNENDEIKADTINIILNDLNYSVPVTMNIGHWAMIGISFNGNSISVYLDGQFEGSIQSLNPDPLQISTLYLGGEVWSERYFGLVDELTVYDDPFTGSEVLSKYHENGWPSSYYNPETPIVRFDFENSFSDSSNYEYLISYPDEDYHYYFSRDRFNQANNSFYIEDNSSLSIIDYFRSGNDVFSLAAIDSIQNQFSLNLWVNPSDQPQELSYLFDWYMDESNLVRLAFDNTLNSISFNINGTVLQVPDVLDSYSWSMITAQYDGSTMKLYINNTQIGSLIIQDSISIKNANVQFGGDKFREHFYRGALDDIKLYSYSISDSLRSALYSTNNWPESGLFEQLSDTLVFSVPIDYHLPFKKDDDDIRILPSKRYYTLPSNRFSPTASSALQVGHEKDYYRYSDVYLGALDVIKTDMTISVWVYPTLMHKDTSLVVGRFDYDSDNAIALSILNNNTGFQFRLNDNIISSKSSLLMHQWNQLVATYDGDEMKLHVNGELAVQEAILDSINVTKSDLLLGRNFDGRLDELEIYNYALSTEDIREAYISGDWRPKYRDNPDTLVASFPFYENRGGYGIDTTGYITGHSSLNTFSDFDRFGNRSSSYYFYPGNYVNIKNPQSLKATQLNMTLGLWIKPESPLNGESIFYSLTEDAEKSFYYIYSDSTSGKFGLNINGNRLVSTDTLQSNAWQHIAFTYNANHLKLYLNGVFQDSMAYQKTLPSESELFLGTSEKYPNNGFLGNLDDILIFNHSLSKNEIFDLAHQGGDFEPIQPPEITNFMKLAFNNNYLDSSKNDRNIHVVNTRFGLDRFNKINSSLDFKQSSSVNYLEIYSDDLLELEYLRDEFSMSIWVKPTGYINTPTLLGYSGNQSDSFELYHGSYGSPNGYYLNFAGYFLRSNYDKFFDWTHLAITFSDRKLRLFQDGVLVDSTEFNRGVHFANGNLSIGNRYNGQLDEIRFYNYALTQQNIIDQVYAGGWNPDNKKDPKDLIAHYALDNSTIDSTKYHNHLNSSNFTNTSDRFGNDDAAALFDTRDKQLFIKGEDFKELSYLDNGLSLLVWVLPADTVNLYQNRTIFYKEHSSTDNNFHMYLDRNGRVNFNINNTRIVAYDDTLSYTDWTYLAATVSKDTVRLYINNKLVSKKGHHFDGLTTNSYFTIGNQLASGDAKNFIGKIDEVRIFNYAVDSSLIDSLYKPLVQVVGNETSIEIPSDFKLYQNYPNPFNPSTKITFDIPKESMVSIKVYDISGRLVNTITNDRYLPGSYSLNFNSGKLASGVYIYRLISDGYSKSLKFTLIK